ncbi:MAG: hypothetical protein KAR18_06285 [Spirochaetes bacterium]|nr:hypothetical protein [Spirochaetota bacterium]
MGKRKFRILIKSSALIFTLLLLSISTLIAAVNTEPLARPVIPQVRAMGGAFTAVANDEKAVFYNPAGYAAIDEGKISVFSLSTIANIDRSALKVYGALARGVNVFLPSNQEEYFSNTTIAMGVVGPIYFGRVGNDFGFSFYNSFSSTLDSRPGGFAPFAEYLAYSDLGFVGGYGFELPFLKNLYAGFNLKVILRAKIETSGTLADVLSTLEDTSHTPLAKAIGFGGDVGFLYRPVPSFSVGFAVTDFFVTWFSDWQIMTFSEEEYPRSYIKPRIPFGVALYPLAISGKTEDVDRLVIALDYSDLLDYTSFLSNIKLGVSFRSLKVISVYGGFDGGFLAGGVGLSFKIFHTCLVYYVDELGAYPGANPVQNILLNFAFRW